MPLVTSRQTSANSELDVESASKLKCSKLKAERDVSTTACVDAALPRVNPDEDLAAILGQ